MKTTSMMRAAAWRVLSLGSPLWRSLPENRLSLRILAYHGVDDADRFAAQMVHLRERYVAVSLEDVVAFVGGEELPPSAVWITFDDGHPSVIENGLPVLDSNGLPATLFVCPGVVDTSDPFWWQLAELAVSRHPGRYDHLTVGELKKMPDEVRRSVLEDLKSELMTLTPTRRLEVRQATTEQLRVWIGSGRTVGNHTWDHPLLDKCSEGEQKRQVSMAHDWLVSELAVAPRAFAYPNGNWTRASEMTLEGLGYEVAVLFDHSLARARSALRLSRIRVNSGDPLHEFSTRVAGVHPAFHSLRGKREL